MSDYDNKVQRLVQAILDSSDGHDMESYAEEVLDEDEVEDFMESCDGSDQEGLIEEYVDDLSVELINELFDDYGIK